MNRLHHSLIALLVALTTWSATAQTTYRVEDVPNVQLIDYTRFVSDPADAINEADEAALNQRIGYLRDSLDVEIAVVVLPAIDGDTYGSAREFANELFNTWGIGKKETDRGLLILLITNEDNREITFEVGYGLEGQLTDGLCKLIQKRRMIPPMKEGRYGEGLLAGVEEVRKVLTGESTLEADAKAQDEKETKDFVIMVCSIWWLFGGLICAYLLHSQRKERPRRSPRTSEASGTWTFLWVSSGCSSASSPWCCSTSSSDSSSGSGCAPKSSASSAVPWIASHKRRATRPKRSDRGASCGLTTTSAPSVAT